MDGAIVQADEQPGARPEIRQDLNLFPAGEDEVGHPVWHLQDPLANRYFQMQERDVQILALVGHKNAEEIALQASQFKVGDISAEEVQELLTFLRRNNLVKGDSAQQSLYQEVLSYAKQREWWQLAIKNPLFFRIPLWKPDRFLDASLPYVSWLATRTMAIFLLTLGVLGVYLVSRQIDQFFATFLHFFNWSGLVVYFFALFVVKIFHELGHAYTAKMMGCRVPVIGVAFMVGWPILYTDTSDAWKVPEKSRRLKIGVAGVSVELAIAVVCLFLWAITPDGSLRSAFFLLSTTTWVLSIFVNFNPLMRFDGYYLLSDLVGMPNLEPRSFAMARWWLREKIFGLGLEPPERIRMGFVLFAFGVWIYRFLLFLGIALLVYGFFFKAAGIALFVLEVVYFIARPIFNELKEWWALRELIKWNDSTRRVVVLLSLLVLFFFVPWYSDVSAQATLKLKSNDLYLPVPGMLVKLHEPGPVIEGELLFEFEAPELELEIEEVGKRYEELSWMRSSLGFDSELRNETLIVESELRTQSQRLRSLVDQQSRLKVTAPFDGVLVDISTEVILRDWLPVGMKLGTVVVESEAKVEAYLPEDQLARVEPGMTARFFPESLEFGIHDLVLSRVEFMGTPELENLYVASTFGGDVAVRETGDGELVTVQSQYKLELVSAGEPLMTRQVVRGVAIIDGHSESLFSRIRKRITSVLIRETGF